MKWMGKKLEYKEDWATALLSLTSSADAIAFTKAAQKVFGDIRGTAKALGYLTVEIPPGPDRQRIQELLNVRHPFGLDQPNKLNAQQIFDLGVALGQAGKMEHWHETVAFIPRRDWSPTYK